MSGLQQHVRANHSPPHVKKSARSAPGISQKVPGKASSKPRKPRKQAKEDDDEEEEVFEFEEDDHMATTFLQYCTMCDKQILVPNSKFLYCSEHCRRMDALPQSSSFQSEPNFSQSYKLRDPQYQALMDPHGLSLPRYVPALKPTPRPFIDARIPPKHHDGVKSDLDPTEWKPSEPSDSDDDHGTGNYATKSRSGHGSSRSKLGTGDRNASDASLYLSKFHLSSGGKERAVKSGTLPPLSRASTATASSTCSSASSLSGSPYSLVSPPPVSVATTSVTASANVSGVGFEGLSLEGQDILQYEKKKVKDSARKSAASGSLKKLLVGEQQGGM